MSIELTKMIFRSPLALAAAALLLASGCTTGAPTNTAAPTAANPASTPSSSPAPGAQPAANGAAAASASGDRKIIFVSSILINLLKLLKNKNPKSRLFEGEFTAQTLPQTRGNSRSRARFPALFRGKPPPSAPTRTVYGRQSYRKVLGSVAAYCPPRRSG